MSYRPGAPLNQGEVYEIQKIPELFECDAGEIPLVESLADIADRFLPFWHAKIAGGHWIRPSRRGNASPKENSNREGDTCTQH